MKDINLIDYSDFDTHEILSLLFYPRPQGNSGGPRKNFSEIQIPVEKGITIGGRFYFAGKTAPLMLFFHGNGEIVADYDDLAALYIGMGISFLPVDYRGYGISTGSPTVTGMMRDCHVIFEYIKKFREDKNIDAPLIIMGRSLGSASAIEIASSYENEIGGLIIESGFAYIMPLLSLLGINTDKLSISGESGFHHIEKIGSFNKPVLVIHARLDHIIPFTDGLALYNASKSPKKRLLEIKHANHNNIFELGLAEYMQAIRDLIKII